MKKADIPPAVSIPVHQAEQLLELYRNIEAADAHFQRCQSDSFRQHVKSVYRAPNVAAAYEQLKAAVAEAKEQNAKKKEGD